MQPIEITEEMVADTINGTVVTYQAPPGAEDDVNAVQGLFELGVPGRFGPDRIYIPLKPDAEDLERLNAGEPLWLVILSHRMPVFQTYVQPLPGDPFVPLIGGPHDGNGVARADVRIEQGLHPRIHMDATGSVYELSGGAYYFVADAEQPTIMHDAAGPCEPGYHRAMPDGKSCRCGAVRSAPIDGTEPVPGDGS